MVNQTI